MADSREVMNIRQASQYLGVSPDTLYKYVNEQKIPAFKLANRWRFKKSKLDQWMEEKVHPDGSGAAGQEETPKSGCQGCRIASAKAGTCLDSDRRRLLVWMWAPPSIKAVELRKGRASGIEVAHLGLEPIAPDIVVDSMIVDSGTVSSAISKLFTDTEIKAKARGHGGQRALRDREENLAALA